VPETWLKTRIAQADDARHDSDVEDEDVKLVLTILADIRTDVRRIRWELEDGEEEGESDNS
jgi:hypothetical protein